ncbi:MAG: extracellular solute-binding protein [Edaphobacter sp.]|uniref:extracellular solute-binding protein n=1 Tax=Edaphobacter sp. TaxID=1934404 RepID=UPI00239DB30E|nr:extracellular solute-binding protein [Edaphobacter sp.]MDE1178570.1 extracellular solute-binding protein [Edaphobacter sp.]
MDFHALDRRRLLRQATLLAIGATLDASPAALLAQELHALEVACAGSMRAMTEGPLKLAAAKTLSLDLRAHAQGADAVAQSIVDGSLRADVFLPITATPMMTVLRAGKAETAVPIARTEMVLVYSPKSRFAAQFEAAARGQANWWEILQQPGVRIGRSDPRADPGGRNIIFMMMLAAKKYRQPDLVQKVLGDPLNPQQVGNGQARLQTGELDAGASYRISAISSHLPFITLPADVNLSSLNLHAEHPDLHLTFGERTFYPDPLAFYAAALGDAIDRKSADAFVQWLRGSEAQSLFRENGFQPADAAVALHA